MYRHLGLNLTCFPLNSSAHRKYRRPISSLGRLRIFLGRKFYIFMSPLRNLFANVITVCMNVTTAAQNMIYFSCPIEKIH